MKKTFTRGFGAVILLGALSGVLGGGSASALNCRPVGSVLLVCTGAKNGGRQAIVYSDVVEVHASVVYGSNNETGILIGDGFTNQFSGALVSCDSTKNKYRLTTAVIGSFKNRKLAVPC